MIKSELTKKIGRNLPNLPEHKIARAVSFILETMSQTLSENRRIEIRDFGSFSTHYLPPREAHDPRTGEKIITTGKHKPHFKMGKQLKTELNFDDNC